MPANSTADRAIEILLLFSESKPVLSAIEVAARFKMSRSTTYRYLRGLKDQGLVEELASGGYRLGYRIFDLARAAQSSFSILEIAQPHLRALARETSETVLLSYLTGRQIIILECVPSPHRLRITYDRGQLLPTPAGATARAFLAFADSIDAEGMLKDKQLRRYTSQTNTNAQKMLRQVEEVRKNGFAINEGELDEGVSAVAAPVLNEFGPVQYCVTVVGPSTRLPRAKLLRLGPTLQEVAGTISKAAGQQAQLRKRA